MVTPSAIEGLKSLLAGKSADPARQGLRLAVERGGCAGLQYAMSLTEPSPGDEIVDCVGVRIFVDAASQEMLDGCSLDYSDDLTGAGFRVINPHAARSCGCGTSFEPV